MPQATAENVAPWYMYPLDTPGGSYGQIQEPLGGGYLKPDVNIAVPPGLPITAAGSGTVTSVTDHGKSSGGLSVVVALDSPINSVATHEAYNYLGGASVSPGQKVKAGQQLGTAGSPYNVLTAFALTSDNVWGNGSFNLNANGNPNLDPHIVLNALRGGKSIPSIPGSSAGGSVLPGSNVPIVGPIIDWFNGQMQAFQTQFGPLLQWLTNPIRVIKMVVGVLLLGLASVLLIAPPIASKVAEYALPQAKEALIAAAA